MTLGGSNYQDLAEYRLAGGVADLIRKTCDDLQLDRDREWIEEVLREAADNLTNALAEGYQSEYTAEYLLGVGSARNSIVIASYCLRFLRGEGILHPEQSDYLDERLDDLESALAALAAVLRENLPNQRRFLNN
jgi:hypothetical protein